MIDSFVDWFQDKISEILESIKVAFIAVMMLAFLIIILPIWIFPFIFWYFFIWKNEDHKKNDKENIKTGMDKSDAERVIDDLQNKPFICSDSTIKTESGYLIITNKKDFVENPKNQTNAERIREMSDEELAGSRIDRIDFYTKSDTPEYIGDFAGIANNIEEANTLELAWLQSEVEE